MEIFLTRGIESLLLPPGISIILMLLGVVMVRYLYRTGTLMILGGFFLFLASSIPIAANSLLFLVESIPPIAKIDIEAPQAGAIVVLGAGRRSHAPEYGAPVVSPIALERLRYAALLHKQTGLPILLSGGNPLEEAGGAESQLMQNALETSFAMSARWLEQQSKNTWENAVHSKAALTKDGIEHVILVTHAAHMRRAMYAFKTQGMRVTAAPMGFSPPPGAGPVALRFLPSAAAMQKSHTALHELIGRLWYRFRYPPVGTEPTPESPIPSRVTNQETQSR